MDASLKRLAQIDYGVPVVIQELLHEGELRTRLLELGFLRGPKSASFARRRSAARSRSTSAARASRSRIRILESILVGPLA